MSDCHSTNNGGLYPHPTRAGRGLPFPALLGPHSHLGPQQGITSMLQEKWEGGAGQARNLLCAA